MSTIQEQQDKAQEIQRLKGLLQGTGRWGLSMNGPGPQLWTQDQTLAWLRRECERLGVNHQGE